MAQHTPGPFEAQKGNDLSDPERCGVYARRGLDLYHVATIENGAPGDFCDTEWANALLFAAAPELLEALRDIAEATSAEDDAGENYRADDREGALDYAYAKAMQAIAKATGQ